MKFIIKTSAVGISDSKFAPCGEYETTDRREIDRLKDIASRHPEDIEIAIEEKKDEKKKVAPASDKKSAPAKH